MEKLFYPESIAIVGLSSSANNIPRIVLENLIRWGYKGRIYGINPRVGDAHVDGIKMYKDIQDLPVVPDLVFIMIPARLIPEVIDSCGKAGVKRMAIPSGGFNESGEERKKLSEFVLQKARQYGIRFVGPNGVTVANTANGLSPLRAILQPSQETINHLAKRWCGTYALESVLMKTLAWPNS